MHTTDILIPMAALALWTLAVLSLIPYQRCGAAAKGLVKPSDFIFGESANVPGSVSIPNRNMMNLLEIPVLFYVACLTLVVIARVDTMFVALAWAFLALRVCHSLVHLTYNNIMHRVAFFALSNLVVLVIWLRILFLLTA